jgi:hypothetical protein
MRRQPSRVIEHVEDEFLRATTATRGLGAHSGSTTAICGDEAVSRPEN